MAEHERAQTEDAGSQEALPTEEAESQAAVGEGEASPSPAAEAADMEALLQRAEELDAQSQHYLQQAQRLKADFDNYRRRMLKEQQSWKSTAVAEVVTELLPIMDNLERALAAVDEDDAQGPAASLRQGVAMTLKQFNDVLRRIGVEPIDAEGAPFDPQLHEAMAQELSRDHEDGIVLEELQKGYRYETRLLRPSLVRVARQPRDEEEGDDDE